MYPPRHSRRRLRAGLTLVELLVAVVIASLVITVVFSIFHTVTTALRGQVHRMERADGPDTAVRMLAEDLNRLMSAAEDPRCALSLSKAPGAALERSSVVSFCVTRAAEDEVDLRWHTLRHVVYEVETSEGSRLVRREQDLAGPDGASTNALAEPVLAFHVDVLSEGAWYDEWPQEDLPHPSAARIELISSTGGVRMTNRVETLIPVGLVFTSAVPVSAGAGR